MQKKILVVDNSPIMLKFMTNLLVKKGHQVMTAEDGLSALDILKSYTPDIIFVDLIMPSIDGKRLCRIIRSKQRKHAFIVVLSAIAVEEEANIDELGANVCIAKGPLNQMSQQILSVLHRPDLASSQFLSGNALGSENIYPRKITEELLAVKRHFEVILERISEGILEITPEGRILYANPTALSLIHITEEKALGSNFFELFTEEDRRLASELPKTSDDKPGTANKKTLVNLNEHQVTLNILHIDGNRHTAIIILNDVTEQKRAEETGRRERDKLQQALAKVKMLSGLLPICANCKRIRDDRGYWNKIETYIKEHSEADFTHSLCPECKKSLYPGFYGDNQP